MNTAALRARRMPSNTDHPDALCLEAAAEIAAGHIRNTQMLVECKPDLVVAFEGGKGTANMVRQAEAAGVRVLKATKIVVQ